MKKSLLLLFLSLVLMACSSSPSDRLLDSLKAIEAVMQAGVTEPEILVAELEKCVKEHRVLWKDLRLEFEDYNELQLMRELGTREPELRAIMTRIVDLDLEIQDRIMDQYELRDRYMAAIRSIGR